MTVRPVPSPRRVDRKVGVSRVVGIAGLAVLIVGAATASALGRGEDGSPAGPGSGECVACHALPDRGGESAADVRDDGVGAANVRPPFRHADHRDLSCRECHPAGDRHRSPRVWTAADCGQCHHASRPTIDCAECHERAEFVAPRRVAVHVAMSVWQETRDRELVFEHGTHEPIACVDCHRTPVTRAPQECASCHADHHRPEAECARCHETPGPEAHGRDAHLGCAGSGCHADASVDEVVRSRTSCLVCHGAQRDHRPGKACVRCHIMPEPSRAPPTEADDRPDRRESMIEGTANASTGYRR